MAGAFHKVDSRLSILRVEPASPGQVPERIGAVVVGLDEAAVVVAVVVLQFADEACAPRVDEEARRAAAEKGKDLFDPFLHGVARADGVDVSPTTIR